MRKLNRHSIKASLLQFCLDFLLCGTLGWLIEILFTSLQSLRERDLRLRGTTSLWMFPIYGMAALFYPFSILLKRLRFPAWLRGISYSCAIFSAEYLSGKRLQKKKCCPWSYANCRMHIGGIIRLDYAGYWALFGLFLEKLFPHWHTLLTCIRTHTGTQDL